MVDALDDCILVYQRTPGVTLARHVSVDTNNDVYVGSVQTKRFVKLDGTDGKIIDSEGFGGTCGGYGGLISVVNGEPILWSADLGSGLLRRNLAQDSSQCLAISASYGLGIDPAGNIWNSR